MTDVEPPHDPLSDALQEVLLAHTCAQARLSQKLGARRGDVDALEHLMTESLGPTELARRLGISQGAVTQLVERMEHRGHAARATDPTDGRRVLVSLTDAGRATVHDHALAMLHRLDALAASLDDAGAAGTLRYLLGAADALADLAQDPETRPRGHLPEDSHRGTGR